MSNEAKYHPSEQLLADFSSGSLSTGLSVVIAAHIELCPQCREQRQRLETEAADAWRVETQQQNDAGQRDFSPVLRAITSKLNEDAAVESVQERPSVLNEIHLHEGSVTLPRVLAKLAGEGLVWKKLAGGINQAGITLDDETQCEFLYMKPGSQVPVHRHRGNEITLVLDGSFSDEMGHYTPADFVMRDPSHQHQPMSEEGCLCFAVQDSPLMFTRGLARLLNPFIQYRFKQALSRAR